MTESKGDSAPASKSALPLSESDCLASGKCSSAEGINTRALATASHAEGVNSIVEDEPAYDKHASAGHAEGSNTRAFGWFAHAEGASCWAEGLIAHAQNCITLASGNDSHTEGVQTVTGRRRYFIRPEDQGLLELEGHGIKPYFIVRADPILGPDGDYTREFVDQPVHAVHGAATSDPYESPRLWWRHNTVILFSVEEVALIKAVVLKSMYDSDNLCTHVFYDHAGEAFPAPGRIMLACASYAPEGSDTTYNDGKGQHAEGKRTNAAGNFAHAEGRDTTCFGRYSHAEGYMTRVTGNFGAHGEGHNTAASGHFAHAEGSGTLASGNASHAEGCETVASGECAHASGFQTEASGDCSFAAGTGTHAMHPGAFIVGQHGVSDTPHAWHLADGTPGQPALKARIDSAGGHHAGYWAAGGGSYAQCFDWADGNPSAADRVGLFVNLKNDCLILAESAGEYVLGVVTATPAFIGGDDAFFRKPNTRQQERAAVALVGRVLARDNGQCRQNGFCRPGPGGVAVPAPDGYRVLRRIDGNNVELVIK